MAIAPGVDIEGMQPEAKNGLLTALAALDKAGIGYTVTSGARSTDTQARLYAAYQARGFTGLPAAPPGSSNHEKGTAVDLSIPPAQRSRANDILAAHGFSWLGARDPVHYDFTRSAIPASLSDPSALLDAFTRARPTVRQQTEGLGLQMAVNTILPDISPPPPESSDDLLRQFRQAGRAAAPANASADQLLAQFQQARQPAAPSPRTAGLIGPNGQLRLSPALAGAQPAAVDVGGITVRGLNTPAPDANLPAALRPAGPGMPAAGVVSGIQRAVNTVTTPISVGSALINSLAGELGKPQYQHPDFRLSDLSAFSNAVRQAKLGETFLKGITGKAAAFPTPVGSYAANAAPEAKQRLQNLPGGTGAWDLLLSFPILGGMGEAQSAVAGATGRGLSALNQATGAGDRLIGAVPGLAARLEKSQAMAQTRNLLDTNAAFLDQFARQGADVAEDVRRTSQRYLRNGVPIRGTHPLTGKPVNLFDQAVADYIEAGTQGAQHADRPAALAAAQRLGIDPADVIRIGDRYSDILTQLGQHLVNHGLLDPGAYAALQGRYLPRLYLLTSGNPAEVEQFLKLMEQSGAMTPEAIRAARAVAGKSFTGGGVSGPREFTQGREIADYLQRNNPGLGRALVPEATPAALRAIATESRAAGEAAGHAEIALNPALAQPQATAPASWVNFEGSGPLQGMAVHPGVDAVLRARANPDQALALIRNVARASGASPARAEQIASAYANARSGFRKLLLSSPKTQQNIIIGHAQLTQAAAAMHGASFSVLDYGKALRELAQEAAGGPVAPYLRELRDHTNILSEGSSLLPREARQISGGFGVETPLQNAVQGGKNLIGRYLGTTHDVLAAGKYGLYKSLRQAGHSIADAARLTKAGTVDYSSLPPLVQFLDRNNITPFVSFPARAVGQYLNQAIRRPDLFYSGTGQRARDYLDLIADQYARQQGRQPEAQQRRKAGLSGLTTFPVPGMTDQAGAQLFAKAPILAPLLHHFAGGPTQDLTEPLKAQLKNALPIPQLFHGLLTNQDTRSPQPRPIVPPGGYPPGDREVPATFALYLAKALLPAAGDAERVIRAATGTTPYASTRVGVQRLKSAALQALTGVQVAPGLAESPAERQQRESQRLLKAGGEKYGAAAMDRLGALLDRYAADPAYRPNREYAAAAHGYEDAEIGKAIKNATDRLQGVIYGQHYTGTDRQAAIQRLLDWIFSLAAEQESRGRTPSWRHVIGDIRFPLANAAP